VQVDEDRVKRKFGRIELAGPVGLQIVSKWEAPSLGVTLDAHHARIKAGRRLRRSHEFTAVADVHIRSDTQATCCAKLSRMPLIVILVILLLLFGGGGYYMGPGLGYYGGGGLSLVLLLVILYILFGRGRGRV